MRSITSFASIVLWVSGVWAAPISAPEELSVLELTTLDFDDLQGLEGDSIGRDVGQPYADLGVSFDGHVPKDPSPDIGSASNGLALTASGSCSGTVCFQTLRFAEPQRGVGLFVADSAATRISVEALDASGQVLEHVIASEQASHVGVLRDTADISLLVIVTMHASAAAAAESPCYVDDLSWGRELAVVAPAVPGEVDGDEDTDEPAVGQSCAAIEPSALGMLAGLALLVRRRRVA